MIYIGRMDNFLWETARDRRSSDTIITMTKQSTLVYLYKTEFSLPLQNRALQSRYTKQNIDRVMQSSTLCQCHQNAETT